MPRPACLRFLTEVYIYTLPSDGGNLARAPALLSPLAPAPTQLSESQLTTLKDIPVSGRDSSRQRWKSYTNEEEKQENNLMSTLIGQEVRNTNQIPM